MSEDEKSEELGCESGTCDEVCVCVCVCARALCACVRVCVHMRVCVYAFSYDKFNSVNY